MPFVPNKLSPPSPDSSNAVLYEMMLFYKASMENAQAQSMLDRVEVRRARIGAQMASQRLLEAIRRQDIQTTRRLYAEHRLVLKHEKAHELKLNTRTVMRRIAKERARNPGQQSVQFLAEIEQLEMRAEEIIMEQDAIPILEDDLEIELFATEILAGDGAATPIDLTGEETTEEEDN